MDNLTFEEQFIKDNSLKVQQVSDNLNYYVKLNNDESIPLGYVIKGVIKKEQFVDKVNKSYDVIKYAAIKINSYGPVPPDFCHNSELEAIKSLINKYNKFISEETIQTDCPEYANLKDFIEDHSLIREQRSNDIFTYFINVLNSKVYIGCVIQGKSEYLLLFIKDNDIYHGFKTELDALKELIRCIDIDLRKK